MTTEAVEGTRLRTARLMRGWTRNELGRKIGVNQNQVKAWEDNDEWLEDKETVLRLAMLLSFPVGFFYGSEIKPISQYGCSLPGVEDAYK